MKTERGPTAGRRPGRVRGRTPIKVQVPPISPIRPHVAGNNLSIPGYSSFYMSMILSRNLSRKKVMSNDGMVIGTLRNVMVDFDTGQVVDLIVVPDPNFNVEGFRMDGDRMFIPFEAVKDIKDYIVVDRYLSKK